MRKKVFSVLTVLGITILIAACSQETIVSEGNNVQKEEVTNSHFQESQSELEGN